MLDLIIERGCHHLQTSKGERLPRVIETMVRQYAAEPGKCQFTMFVDQPGLFKYDDRKKQIVSLSGQVLRDVTVLKYKPAEGELKPAVVLCECMVGFHYDTSHKAHFAKTLAT